MARKKTPQIKELYYITHMNNLPSIFKNGILSHHLMEQRSVNFTPVYDAAIVGNRKEKKAPNGKSLWEFANLYFQPRNPMLYRVLHERGNKDIVILGLKHQVLQTTDGFITDGNAASAPTLFYRPKEGLKAVQDQWDIIEGEWWNSLDGSKRKIMAECLIPGSIPPETIHTIYVANHSVADRVRGLVPSEFPVIPEPSLFFRPSIGVKVSGNLSLAEGDMFFSHMQTLTVSVNVIGIMGKGLASRAKYQFPDVYVVYQDACRSKALGMGKPFLYKREASFDEELADEPSTLLSPNRSKWFLFFATKRHWREDSDLPGIEEGLKWLASNYKADGIQSIALPALGCGLGKLEWKDVGPMMCSYLSKLEIPAVVYLPREREIPAEHLTSAFLLSKREG